MWQLAMHLAVAVYELTDAFPGREVYGMTDQMRRAAASVATNIAEGNGRAYRAEYVHFLSIARGSLREVHTLAEIARRRSYMTEEQFAELSDVVDHAGRMLTRMMKRLSCGPSRRARTGKP